MQCICVILYNISRLNTLKRKPDDVKYYLTMSSHAFTKSWNGAESFINESASSSCQTNRLAAFLVRAPCKTACHSTRSPAMTTLYTQLLKAKRKKLARQLRDVREKTRENVPRQGFYRTIGLGSHHQLPPRQCHPHARLLSRHYKSYLELPPSLPIAWTAQTTFQFQSCKKMLEKKYSCDYGGHWTYRDLPAPVEKYILVPVPINVDK